MQSSLPTSLPLRLGDGEAWPMVAWLTSAVSGSHTVLLDGLGLFLLRADSFLGKEKW